METSAILNTTTALPSLPPECEKSPENYALTFLCANLVISGMGLALILLNLCKFCGNDTSRPNQRRREEDTENGEIGSLSQKGKKRYTVFDSRLLLITYSLFGAIIISKSVDRYTFPDGTNCSSENGDPTKKENLYCAWKLNRWITFVDKITYLAVALVLIGIEYKRRPRHLHRRSLLKLLIGSFLYISLALGVAKYYQYEPGFVFVSYFTNMIRLGAIVLLVVACRPRFKTFKQDFIGGDCLPWIFIGCWLPYNILKIAKAIAEFNAKLKCEIDDNGSNLDWAVYTIGSLATVLTPICFHCFKLGQGVSPDSTHSDSRPADVFVDSPVKLPRTTADERKLISFSPVSFNS